MFSEKWLMAKLSDIEARLLYRLFVSQSVCKCGDILSYTFLHNW
jgi:hypothetical protein